MNANLRLPPNTPARCPIKTSVCTVRKLLRGSSPYLGSYSPRWRQQGPCHIGVHGLVHPLEGKLAVVMLRSGGVLFRDTGTWGSSRPTWRYDTVMNLAISGGDSGLGFKGSLLQMAGDIGCQERRGNAKANHVLGVKLD